MYILKKGNKETMKYAVRTEDACVVGLRANGCKGIGAFCGVSLFPSEKEAHEYAARYKKHHPNDRVWAFPTLDNGRTAEAQCVCF